MTDKPNTFVGLDLGGAQIRCLVAVASGGELQYLGCGVLPPARWDDSEMSEAYGKEVNGESVYEVICEAEDSAGTTVVSAVVGVAARGISSRLVHTGVQLPAEVDEVRPSDVQGVIARAAQGLAQRDTIALQFVPLEFTTDKSGALRDPVGHPARRLEAFVRIVAMPKSDHDGVSAVVHEAGIAVEDTVLGGFAAALCTLTQEERDEGVAHIEFGRVATILTVYCGDRLRLAVGLPVGYEDLVEDLARSLKTSAAVALSLIADFGRIEFALGSQVVQVFVPGSDAGDPVGSGAMRSWSHVNEIITRRVRDCLCMVRDEIRKIQVQGDAVRSLVLSGDMAALPGMRERARDWVRLPTRIGQPAKMHDLPPALQNPGWASAAGAVLYAHQLACWQERYEPEGSALP